MGRLTPYAGKINGEYQCGFIPCRSTIDQIFTIYQLLEKHWEHYRGIQNICIDLKQAYDSIDRNALKLAVLEMDI